jgi:ATP-dependent DNA helicase DinG
LLPPPVVFGLPEKFDSWRGDQAEAVEAINDSSTRFTMLAAPTGFGKSLVYVAAAVANGGRACILTSTKGLQDQLCADFREIGLTDVRGANSYPCLAADHFGLPNYTSCAEGPCHTGASCSLKNGGCLYYDAYRAAISGNLVVTNYSYWMHSHRYSEGLGSFDLVILDEAHNAPDELAGFVGVDLDAADIGNLLDDGRLPDVVDSSRVWRDWGQTAAIKCKYRLDLAVDRLKQAYEFGQPLHYAYIRRAGALRLLLRKLEVVATISSEWAVERKGRVTRLDPVWPAPYAERFLFLNCPRVCFVSATVRPKTAQLLGVNTQHLTFIEYESSFPKERRPVYHVDTIAIKHSTPDDEMRIWVTRIDQIIRARLDRKGIIHTTSYARRDLLLANSEFKKIMLWHGTKETADIVSKFKARAAPCVLVSPSLTTGWDFPYRDAEYQVVAKCPFPDFTSALARARDKDDPNWSKYCTMLALVQTTGRGMRAADDRCETLLVDDNVTWFIRKYAEFAPGWWLEAYESRRTLPVPPPKL